MITLKTDEEIELIAHACEIVADVLGRIEEHVRPGVSTAELDAWAEDHIRGFESAYPAFKGLYGFRPRCVRASTTRSCTGYRRLGAS